MPSRGDLDALLERCSRLELQELNKPALRRRCRELRAWQAARLARTYADLSRDPRYARGVAFLLEDLYGMHDFARRARDLVRAWDQLEMSLPQSGVELLRRTVEFEVLTGELDHATALELGETSVTEHTYAVAYRAAGQRRSREQQLELALAMGLDLERAARNPLVVVALAAAHIPARVAGFGVLQSFLERGYAAFRDSQGRTDLLDIVREREILLMQRLFDALDNPFCIARARRDGVLMQ